MEIKQILEEVERIHPYRIPGRRETYDSYAEGWTDAVNEIESRLPAEPEPGWIPVSERLPEEHDSMFSKFHGTPRWRPSMWLRQSDRVLVTSELADGTRITETARTRDGEWKPDHAILKREIVAWMPMPEPYKEDRK